MFLTPYQAQHIHPELWKTITPEQREAACSIDLELLNSLPTNDLDEIAKVNPIAAAYVWRRYNPLTSPEAPIPNLVMSLRTDDPSETAA